MSRKFKLTLFWVLFVGLILLATALNILFPPQPITVRADDISEGTTSYFYVPEDRSSVIVDNLPFLEGWVPSDYTYGDMLTDIAGALIGNYTATSSNLMGDLLPDLMDYIATGSFSVDTSSGFIRSQRDDVDDFFNDFQHLHSFTYPSEDVIGSWLKTSNSDIKSIYQGPSASGNRVSFKLRNSSWAEIPNDFYISVVGGSFIISSELPGCIVYAYINNTYQDYVYMNSTYTVDGVTYYYCKWGSNVASGSSDFFAGNGSHYPKYSSNNDALLDLWGTDHPSEPVFTGDMFILDNPSPYINILSLPGNNGIEISERNNELIRANYPVLTPDTNKITYSPNLSDIPNNYEYELPVYPEIPHDLPEIELSYPEVLPIQGLEEGLENLNGLWVTLLVMGGSFIVLKVIL